MFDWLKRLLALLFAPSKPAPKALPAPREVTLHNLRVGDVVAYIDDTYVVSQKITNHANGFFWHDYRLDDGPEKHLWLSVEDDDELVVALFRPIALEIAETPPDSLTWDGKRFRLREKGKSDAKIQRQSGQETRTTVQSWDYEAEDGALLGVQRWGESEFEAMLGQVVTPSLLDLMGQPD